MTYQNLLVENQDGIIILTVNREKALNALNNLTVSELASFFSKDYEEIDNLKGVVITGAGAKAFVAGADITEFIGLDAGGASLAKKGQDVLFLIERFHKPVIAAVNGFALGGGCELAMACHIRVASESARFGQPEVNLGIIPGFGGTQRLTQLIGKGHALEMMMTTDMINAHKALSVGLVNHVVPDEQAVAFSIEILNKIATKAPIAIAKVIESVNAYFDEAMNGYEIEYTAFGECTQTNDFKEGATAFVEKRKANFKNF